MDTHASGNDWSGQVVNTEKQTPLFCHTCRCGEIGRHAVLRGRWRKLYQFESGHRHHKFVLKKHKFSYELTWRIRLDE